MPVVNVEIKARCTNPSLVRTVLSEHRAEFKGRDHQIDTVKFHIDVVKDLGEFVEIEAIDPFGTHDESVLYRQCQEYIQLFGIRPEEYLACSYSDMLMDPVCNPPRP